MLMPKFDYEEEFTFFVLARRPELNKAVSIRDKCA